MYRGKRLLDLVGAALALVVLTPVMAVVAVVVRVTIGRPVLFWQQRPGRDGVPFELVKFRMMAPLAPGADPLDDEGRIPPTGRLLRSTSLDELPELVAVLRGDMSLVGPRPLLVDYLPLYSERCLLYTSPSPRDS